MMQINHVVKTACLLSACLLFSGCSVVQEPLNMSMPSLEFKENACSNIKDDYEYGKCAASQIEALKYDRQVLLTVTQGCVK